MATDKAAAKQKRGLHLGLAEHRPMLLGSAGTGPLLGAVQAGAAWRRRSGSSIPLSVLIFEGAPTGTEMSSLSLISPLSWRKPRHGPFCFKGCPWGSVLRAGLPWIDLQLCETEVGSISISGTGPGPLCRVRDWIAPTAQGKAKVDKLGYLLYRAYSLYSWRLRLFRLFGTAGFRFPRSGAVGCLVSHSLLSRPGLTFPCWLYSGCAVRIEPGSSRHALLHLLAAASGGVPAKPFGEVCNHRMWHLRDGVRRCVPASFGCTTARGGELSSAAHRCTRHAQRQIQRQIQ